MDLVDRELEAKTALRWSNTPVKLVIPGDVVSDDPSAMRYEYPIFYTFYYS